MGGSCIILAAMGVLVLTGLEERSCTSSGANVMLVSFSVPQQILGDFCIVVHDQVRLLLQRSSQASTQYSSTAFKLCSVPSGGYHDCPAGSTYTVHPFVGQELLCS